MDALHPFRPASRPLDFDFQVGSFLDISSRLVQ
jgi:hypothetical protein